MCAKLAPFCVVVEGIDVNSTTPPSEMRMFQLVTNMKFMRVVRRVMNELKAAGFKMNSDVRSPFVWLVGWL